MAREPFDPDAGRSVAELAREFCAFVEGGASHPNGHVFVRSLLAELITTVLRLPPATGPLANVPITPLERSLLVPSHDAYRKVLDPLRMPETIAASLTDDLRDVYRDLARGLRLFDQGDEEDAFRFWRRRFDDGWGDSAIAALRATHHAAIAAPTVDAQGADVGGQIDETRVSLGIYGASLNPDEITAQLGVSATRSHRAGQPKRSQGTWDEGAWIYTREGVVPGEVVRAFLEVLPADTPAWTAIRARYRTRVSVALFFRGWHRGFSLDADALDGLRRLGDVGFSLYAE
ncbi:MAG: DUF5063 domain-containing protein [Myxococcota bacterium]